MSSTKPNSSTTRNLALESLDKPLKLKSRLNSKEELMGLSRLRRDSFSYFKRRESMVLQFEIPLSLASSSAGRAGESRPDNGNVAFFANVAQDFDKVSFSDTGKTLSGDVRIF